MGQAQRKQPARDWPFEVKPLHPALGCEITGITLAQAVEPKTFGKVYEAFLDYELILFRDVDLPHVIFVQENLREPRTDRRQQLRGHDFERLEHRGGTPRISMLTPSYKSSLIARQFSEGTSSGCGTK